MKKEMKSDHKDQFSICFLFLFLFIIILLSSFFLSLGILKEAWTETRERHMIVIQFFLPFILTSFFLF